MRSMNPDHPTKLTLSSTYGNVGHEHTQFDDILYVLREFVCRVNPAIHGRDERALPLTYRDAAILTAEVANLRLKLAHTSIENQKLIEQRDRLHDFYADVSTKFSSIDQFWNDNRRNTDAQNALMVIDLILKSAGVLQDDKPQCPNCASSADYAEETKEAMNLFREQVREVLDQVQPLLQRMVNVTLGDAILTREILRVRGIVDHQLENLP